MIDLDSHLMEPRDFLVPFAPAALAGELILAGAPSADEMRDGAGAGWFAPGAVDRAERRAFLDRTGIEAQVVLPGLSHVSHLGTMHAVEAARAQRRAVLAWADSDDRFVPAAVVPIDDPVAAVALIEEAAAAGIELVLLTASGAMPPPPHLRDPARVWRAIVDHDLGAVLHFGSTGAGIANTWRTITGDAASDLADPIDVVLAHHAAEALVTRLALSGMLSSDSAPRILLAEHGAAWLPGCLTALDACQRAFARHDPNIPQDEPLSAQVCRALTVVPFVFEQVGDLIDRVGPGVIAFGTDHPHPEGGRDPIATFTRSLGDRPADDFFAGTGRRLLNRPSELDRPSELTWPAGFSGPGAPTREGS